MLYNKNDFTKENLDFFLGELAKRFQKQNGKMAVAEIVLIGGAAILAGYNFRESTNDIDAIVASNASLKACVNSITDEYGLSNGWFNSDFVKTESFSQKLPQYSKHYKNFNRNFSVRIITGEYLVAMKLRSFRPYHSNCGRYFFMWRKLVNFYANIQILRLKCSSFLFAFWDVRLRNTTKLFLHIFQLKFE